MSKLFDQNYLKSLCKKFGLTPSKKYGQNFLINPEPIEKMIEAAQIKADDTVVEIGPGFGVLTLALAQKAKKVIAFEIEKKLLPYWADLQKNNIEIIWGNVLKNPVSREAGPFPDEPYKVVANIPYQITSNLIRSLLTAQHPPHSIILMVQKEVAERICAKPGDMSVLSVSVQFFAHPEIITIVPRAYFWPEPAVDSAIIKIEPNQARPENEFFFKIVKAGFANKRKILIKNLEHLINKKNKQKLQEFFTKLGLNDKVRAQELSVQNWLDLALELSTY